MKTLRWQTVSAGLIILSSIGFIWYKVNFHGTYGYHTNIFHNHEFNVFCVVLLVMGLMSLIFLKNADTFEMCNIKKKCGAFSKSLVTIFFIFLIVRWDKITLKNQSKYALLSDLLKCNTVKSLIHQFWWKGDYYRVSHN